MGGGIGRGGIGRGGIEGDDCTRVCVVKEGVSVGVCVAPVGV